MHKIYIDEGSYNIIYQIPQIIYSSLISMFFSSIIKMLALSYKNILQLNSGNCTTLNTLKEGNWIVYFQKMNFIYVNNSL